MILRRARLEDLEEILALYEAQKEKNPDREILCGEIEKGSLYCAEDGQNVMLAVSVEAGEGTSCQEVNWLFGTKPGMLCGPIMSGNMQTETYCADLLHDAEEILRQKRCDAVHCAVSCENTFFIAFLEKQGMRKAGMLRTDREYVCYEKRLTENCPLLPLRMHPAFRGGSLTPWGGDKLKTVYDKPIRDIPTGESLECSCVKDLESTDDAGVTLTCLVKEYGERFAGKYEREPFPLLLKLIDAADKLSVQVHPDDAYAHDHEHGKLGKTEAWLILDAPEGSQLVYGIKEGVTLEELRAACEKGSAVEGLIRFVDVRPGDVCMIPSGCVHAIGAGIMLYEIQQSSDITYRFYDWDRVDKKGNRRELHLEKALDVTDLTIQRNPIPAPDAPCARILDETYFTLDLMHVTSSVNVPDVTEFGILTALDAGLTLTWEGTEIPMKKGETFFLPKTVPVLTLKGEGRAALSMPR